MTKAPNHGFYRYWRSLASINKISDNEWMSSFANVVIHRSQFPEAVRRDLLESVRTRRVNHKFHYDSIKQAQKWLALHEAYSPARREADCLATYERAFDIAATKFVGDQVQVIGLGCGGGQKDVQLLRRLGARDRRLFYTPCDVSTALVLVAREAASAVIPSERCLPFVCDLARADDLPEVFARLSPPDTPRLLTFFGMIPNFEPHEILPHLARLVQHEDLLLFSANLAPGPDYAAGVHRVLPQYDNPLTHDWLMMFLLDLGVESGDGKLTFGIEDGTNGSPAKRITAVFRFSHGRRIKVDAESFEFSPGDSIRLFFSYRYTPAIVRTLLGQHGLAVLDESITASGEEGVFLVKRAG